MKILIVEDEFTSRAILNKALSPYGDCEVAVNGQEALDAFCAAHDKEEPYDLLCLDIRLPEIDGQEVLVKIRSEEKERGILLADGVKVIMTTGISCPQTMMTSFREGCQAYLLKPIDIKKLFEELKNLGFEAAHT